MIRPEPDSLDALLREMTVERFYTTNRDLPLFQPLVLSEPAEVLAERRRVLEDLPAEEDEGALVVPFGRKRRTERAA